MGYTQVNKLHSRKKSIGSSPGYTVDINYTRRSKTGEADKYVMNDVRGFDFNEHIKKTNELPK